MRKIVLAIAVSATPSVAMAKDFTVPAIVIPSAAAATSTPQPATPPPGVLSPPAPPAAALAPTSATSSDPNSSNPMSINGNVTTTLPNHPPPPVRLLSPNVPLTNRQAQAAAISRRWRNRPAAAGEGRNGSVNYMYGASIPSLVCSPLHVSNIELEPGEVVNDIKAGDSVRWLVTPSVVGSGATAQTVISVKPTDAGLRTNLIIATTKRLYDITLVSHSYSRTDSITFTYPEDRQAQWRRYQQEVQQRFTDTTLASGVSLAALDFNYRLSGDDPSWRPLRVYSDGIKTYIQFPRSMLSGVAPALVALGNDGGLFSNPTKQIVNYRVEGDTYVVDRVLSRAALISGAGSDQDQVEITHQKRSG